MNIKRDITDEIIKYINTDNIIVLHGARQVGKTHILNYVMDFLKEKKETIFFFDLEDSRLVDVLDAGVDSMLAFLEASGFNLENYKQSKKRLFVFIDEIQYLKNPSSLLKLLIDHHKYIQLIVSGSSSFEIKSKFSDSLAGRTVNFEIFNLSFEEFLRFKGKIYNLKKLDAYHLDEIKKLYEEFLLFGAYPKIVLENSIEKKEKYLLQIIDTYIKKDIRDLAKIKNPEKFNALLKVLAAQSGQLLRISELAKITGLSQPTIENYLFILENTYIIKLLKPFSQNSRTEIIKLPKLFFYDTGIMQILWLNKIGSGMIGNIFETSIFTELAKKYGQDKLNYWRNKNKNEIDFILRQGNEIVPMEVKLNFNKFQKFSMALFCERYKVKKYKIVGLEGEKSGDDFAYPWEV